MWYLGFVGISCILFGGFLVATMFEARASVRFLNGARTALDTQASKLFFIARHVNWTEFISHTLQAVTARVLHDIAHFSLLVVRFIERMLTRTVKYLRNSRPNVLAPKPSRDSFVTTTRNYLSDKLRRSEKPVQDAS